VIVTGSIWREFEWKKATQGDSVQIRDEYTVDMERVINMSFEEVGEHGDRHGTTSEFLPTEIGKPAMNERGLVLRLDGNWMLSCQGLQSESLTKRFRNRSMAIRSKTRVRNTRSNSIMAIRSRLGSPRRHWQEVQIQFRWSLVNGSCRQCSND
jgi:hypothetical protein